MIISKKRLKKGKSRAPRSNIPIRSSNPNFDFINNMPTSPIKSNRSNSKPSLLEKSTTEEDKEAISISSNESSRSKSDINID